jgi:hypothetical protein
VCDNKISRDAMAMTSANGPEALLEDSRIKALPATLHQIRQDKVLELVQAQFRWNHLPTRVSGHSPHPEI